MNIVDFLESNLSLESLFSKLKFNLLTNNVANKYTKRLSIKLKLVDKNSFGDPINYFYLILNQVIKPINKSFLEEFYSSFNKIHSIDLSQNISSINDIDIDFNSMRKIENIITNEGINHRKRNIISSNLLSVAFTDSSSFVTFPLDDNGILNRIGSIKNIDVYIDPYLMYNSEKIYMFDSIFLSFSNLTIGLDIDTPMINYNLSLVVNNPILYYVLSDKTSKDYKEFIMVSRNNKIDDLLY